MRALIIGNGNILNTEIIKENLKPRDIIICCDGGIKYVFEEGIIPHYVIGDLDSSSPQIVQFFESKNVIFKKFNAKKDETDMELSVEFAISLGVYEILILGGIGTRIDHTLTNINLLIKPILANVKARIIDDYNEIFLIDSYIEIIGNEGELVSLIPLSSVVLGITTKGLSYELKDAKMKIGNSLGVSNVMVSSRVDISIKSGYLLVIKSKD